MFNGRCVLSQIVVNASFPAIQSAIKIYGSRDGARIQLDIPEQNIGEIAQLMALRDMAFRVTFEVTKTQGGASEYGGRLK